MKTTILCALSCALTLAARAAIVVPGADGSDGVLNITANTEIDLSQAVTGTWDQNNAANAGKGVYDPAKWAVVFKYSSVNVATGATVTFKNHASRAPVVWLVNGNVMIDGTVSLNGENGVTAPITPKLSEPGPGGFRGGMMNFAAGIHGGKGLGPGAGGSNSPANYGSTTSSLPPYGNPSLIPLIGGSGGSGNPGGDNGSGGGGGGAILIASSNDFVCNGTIRSNGGSSYGSAGGGSGGGLRIVSDSFSGGGVIQAIGVASHQPGGVGRIRIERVVSSGSHQIAPDPSVVPLVAGSSVLLWPPAGAPEARIVSIGGNAVPADPAASFGSLGADVALPQVPTVQVVVETTNVEEAAVVKVRVTPHSEPNNSPANVTLIAAALESIVSPDPLIIRWVATLPANTGYSAIQAHVVRP